MGPPLENGGVGIMLKSKNSGQRVDLSYKLDFKCSNNEAEHKALILGLIAALNIRISKLRIKGDSKLIVKKTLGEYGIKEPSLAAYRMIIQKLPDKFHKFTI